jgi:hypothetical protein
MVKMVGEEQYINETDRVNEAKEIVSELSDLNSTTSGFKFHKSHNETDTESRTFRTLKYPTLLDATPISLLESKEDARQFFNSSQMEARGRRIRGGRQRRRVDVRIPRVVPPARRILNLNPLFTSIENRLQQIQQGTDFSFNDADQEDMWQLRKDFMTQNQVGYETLKPLYSQYMYCGTKPLPQNKFRGTPFECRLQGIRTAARTYGAQPVMAAVVAPPPRVSSSSEEDEERPQQRRSSARIRAMRNRTDD